MEILSFVKRYKIWLFLFLIISLSTFLRFNRLNDLYVFTIDEEYQAFYAWQQVLDPHPIWIGLVASSLEFYLGPYLVYLTAILLSLSNGDPIINAYFASSLGVISTLVIFYTGKNLFNLNTAIIASTLYASLPLFVFFDQKYWNNMPLPLITLLLFLSLSLVKKSRWWWIVFALSVGAIFETHLPPLPLIFVGLWYFVRGKYFKDFKLVFLCVVSFLLFYWPLIVFDINHNFSNLKVLTRMSGNDSQPTITFNPYAKFNTLFDSFGRFWYLKPGNPNADEINFGCSPLSLSTGYQVIGKYTQRTFSSVWLSLISLGLLLYFLLKNLTQPSAIKILALFLAVLIFFYLIFPGGAFEYYILVFFVLFTFVPAILISKLKGKLQIACFGLILIVVLSGIKTVVSTSDEFSLGPKRKLIGKVMKEVGDKPFSIEGRGICHNYEGWRYLFKVYGRTPSQSYTDKGLGWLYPEEIVKDPTSYTIILSEDRIPLTEDLSHLPSIKSEGYRAYIKKN